MIEIDGDSHGETDTKIKDQKRSKFLQSKGLEVIRLTNRDVEKNIEGVMATLEEIISKRKCFKQNLLVVNHPSPSFYRKEGSIS